MRLGDLGDLVVLTLRDSSAAMRALRGLNLPMGARWMALFLAVVLSRFLSVIVMAMFPSTLEGPMAELLTDPVTMGVIELGISIVTAFMVILVGRLFGGMGTFPDAILVIAWIQLILVAVQAVQVLMMAVMPASALLLGLVALILSIYLSVTMTKALHGFRSAALVALGCFGTSLLICLLLGIVLLQFLPPEMLVLPEVPQ